MIINLRSAIIQSTGAGEIEKALEIAKSAQSSTTIVIYGHNNAFNTGNKDVSIPSPIETHHLYC